uniref:Cytochrome P450 monooxygenase n=1 Tax=Cordyceps militaris TaxID=73501 RepID=J3S6Y0_CORMI|nr:cytochrome P450 monooxygenase [Cordyceps militaris]
MQSTDTLHTSRAGLLRTLSEKELLFCLLGAILVYLLKVLSTQSQPKNVKRIGKSRFRTLLTREVPLRFDLEKYGYLGYKEVHDETPKNSGCSTDMEKFCKRHDKPFLIKIYGLDHFVLPIKYLDVLKTVDHGHLNFAQSLNDLVQLVRAIRGDLTYCANTGFIAWTTVNALQICGILTNRTSGRVLFGDLCRDEEYLQAVMKYAEGVFFTGVAFNGVSLGPFRKFVYWLGAMSHRRDLNKAVAHLLPILESRRIQAAQQDEKPNHVDSIQWNLDSMPASPKEATLKRHAQRILHLAFAATGTVTILLTHMIYNVLMHPEYLQPLRDEIELAVSQNGGWTEKALNDMWKLDSFIKETLRVDPPSAWIQSIMMKRKSLMVSGSTRNAKSTSKTKRPTTGVRQRLNPPTWREWPAACPGRFFGVRKTKILFGKLIHNYDVRWEQPTPIRPPNVIIEGQILVNPEAKIQVRARED